MALDKAAYEARVIANLQGAGFKTDGDHAWVAKLAKAFASATVDEIQANAKAAVAGGSSSGEHPIT